MWAVKRPILYNLAKFREDRSIRCFDIAIFVIFQDGGRRHLGFSKIQNFNGLSPVGSQCASLCQISSKLAKGTNGCGITSFEPLSVKIATKLWPVAPTKKRTDRQTDMLIKKSTQKRVFSRMRRSVTAEPIPTKFCTSTPWGDVVIYLTSHRNWLRGYGGVGVRK